MSTTANQQFEGSTIEEALTAAVSSLGEDLEIIDAQRVRRRGVLGMRKRERFEVIAAPGAAEPKGFDDVLRRMVERVDDAERAVGADLADTDPAWWGEAEFVIPEPVGAVASPAKPARRGLRRGGRATATLERGADVEVDVRNPAPVVAPATRASTPTTPGPDAATATASLVEEARQVLADAIPTAAPTPARPTVPATSNPHAGPEGAMSVPQPVIEDDTPEWSRDALLALDLPPALVGRMPCADLEDDLDWVAALAKAISELLETAESISGPCELTGHGAVSAAQLLRGACDGFRLDSLIIDGRRVPATPLELALAIRSLLRDEP